MKFEVTPAELERFSKSAKVANTSRPASSMTSKAIRKTTFEATKQNMDLIEQCRLDWESLYDFRKRRLRSRRYYEGDQWHELMVNPEDPRRMITEKQHINNQGKVAFVQNIIYQIVRNLIGQYRMNPSQSIVYSTDKSKSSEADAMGMALDAALSLNNITELDAALIEEFILSGVVVQKEMFSFWPTRDKEDLYIENVNVNRIFFNNDIRDIRGLDFYRIGEIKDTTIDRMIEHFATTDEQEDAIRDIYRNVDPNLNRTSKSLSTQEIDRLSFFYPDDTYKCRLIEVWYIEHEWSLKVHDPVDGSISILPLSYLPMVKEANAKRKAIASEQGIQDPALMTWTRRYEPYWKVKYLSPWGHCFYESKTVYQHQEHPYVIKLGSLLDGSVKGLIENLIDQQRYINRLISMLDFIMGASAKGVLLVPEDAISEDFPLESIASEWSKFNGVIKIRLKNDNPNAIPKQISANSTNVGAHELLSLQLKFIMEIAGVSPAIQGQSEKAGTPSSLYAQMTQNSMINSKDLFDKFANFKENRDRKALKIIKQFYKDRRVVNVGGRLTNKENTIYDPSFAEIDTDIKTIQGTDSPVYRAIIDETLMTLLNNKMIDIKMFLEHTSLPFADKLLDNINKREQQGGNGYIDPQTGQLADPSLMQNVLDGAEKQADPRALAMFQKMMSGAAA